MTTDEAIKILHAYMKDKYSKRQTEDGPYIMIWPDRVEIMDCCGSIVSTGEPKQVCGDIDCL